MGAPGVTQGSNLPVVFSTNFDDISGGTAGSISKNYVRKTSSTYVKFYVKCVELTSASATSFATYTLSYVLDSGVSKVVGDSYTAYSNPFILIEGLAAGAHALTVTCTENKASITATNPAAATVETDPLILNWIVDTAGAPTVTIGTKPATYSSVTSQESFTFTSSRIQDNYGTLAWTCYFQTFAGTWFACGTAGATTSGTSLNVVGVADGVYTFKVKSTVTPTTAVGAGNVFFYSDLGTLVGEAEYTWTRDITPPELAVTTTPALKSQWVTGKTAKFEFGCKSTTNEVSCTYMCSFDGKNSADYASTTATPGFFACTSPLYLNVKSTTTHSFQSYSVDAAGNPSVYSSIYPFYSDGTTPDVMFGAVDESQTSVAATLNSGATGQYYATDDSKTTTGVAMHAAGSTIIAAPVIDNVQFMATNDIACDSLTPGATACTASAPKTSSSYYTVFQFPYAPATSVYQLAGTYGAILSEQKVNGKYFYNVVDTTNANAGRMNYYCSHPEMTSV